jgi:outer membrane biosynthesis protein TonB
MPKNEDGEFELILGNRQLLSVFFIVVVLLGVFFTMGYIVGRNSPLAIADAPPEKKPVRPLVVDSATAHETPAPATPTQEAQVKETPAQAAPPPVPTETAPQQPVESKPVERAAPKPEPAVAKREPPKPEPPKSKPEAVKPEPVRTAPVDRPSGTYLQLAATSQREADIEVDVLRRKGFRAMAAEIPEKPGTFRVLVGPVPADGINKMKTDLQQAGFPGDKAIRRTL